MKQHKNNFDFLRLTFATFVVITHSYPLSGVLECDILCQITNGQAGLSNIGVKGFFVISGYLIFQSMQRSEHIIDYLWKRVLRLYPALLVVLLFTILLSAFVYQGKVPFFENIAVYKYALSYLNLFRIEPGIAGVFEKNPFSNAINGSLWTIPYEFTMYLLLSFLFIFKKQHTATRAILMLSFIVLLVGNVFFFVPLSQYGLVVSGQRLLDLGVFFIAGSLLASLNVDKVKSPHIYLLLAAIVLVVSLYCGFYTSTRYLSLPVLIIFFGLMPMTFIGDLGNKIGDLSYGIYIYSFPVQQTLMHFYKLNYLELMAYSLIITYLLAYLSWHLVEKNALKFKKLFSKNS